MWAFIKRGVVTFICRKWSKLSAIDSRENKWIEDNSRHFNFYNCNIGLQGDLNELAQLFDENGHSEEAKELENEANALEQAKKGGKEEIQKKGVVNRMKRLVADLGDDKSQLGKAVKGIKHGVSIAQDIGRAYNSIAQWAGFPQVPIPFLKKKNK